MTVQIVPAPVAKKGKGNDAGFASQSANSSRFPTVTSTNSRTRKVS